MDPPENGKYLERHIREERGPLRQNVKKWIYVYVQKPSIPGKNPGDGEFAHERIKFCRILLPFSLT
jgi:hypothetical protein